MKLWDFSQRVLKIIFRHPVTGTSIIPRLPDGRIVLIRRQDNGQWAFPGGMVDWGEDLTQAIQRELAEETGLEMLRVGRLVGVYSAPDRDSRVHSICIAIEVEAMGAMQVRDPFEIADVKAFEMGELPIGTLSHDHDRQLQDYLSGQTVVA